MLQEKNWKNWIHIEIKYIDKQKQFMSGAIWWAESQYASKMPFVHKGENENLNKT